MSPVVKGVEAPQGVLGELLAQQRDEIRIVGATFEYSKFAGAEGALSGPGSHDAELFGGPGSMLKHEGVTMRWDENAGGFVMPDGSVIGKFRVPA